MTDLADFYLIDLESKFTKIDPKQYYLAYSGGRDSHFLLWFIKTWLEDTDIVIVSSNTMMEHHEIRQRMKDNADVVLTPAMKPFEIKAAYGSPCFTKRQDDYIRRYQAGSRSPNTMRYVTREGESMYNLSTRASQLTLSGDLHQVSGECCTHLKKEPFKRYQKETGRKPILGVRGPESNSRRFAYRSCFSKNGTFHPLWDLTTELLDAIYDKYDIPVPEVYQHVNRTGCMGCPYGFRSGNVETELALVSDAQYKFVTEYFRETYAVLGVDLDGVEMARTLGVDYSAVKARKTK
jgi:3'-phosphoadenosine 5'-phosphosulfate sulfotransferase (PAPS reductase)/FAD synthetase